MNQKQLSGFTLIELSIVLVIIGLIVGGVLVGRDLIAAAEMRAQITQLEQITTAINTYRVKYNQLPGDDSNAAIFGLGPEGNGNGIIEMFHGTKQKEGTNAMVNLATAGLIAGTYTADNCVPGIGYPLIKVPTHVQSAFGAASGLMLFTADYTGFNPNGGINLQYLGDGAMWVTLMTGNISDTTTCYSIARGGFSSADLHNLDTKVDDGIPFTGKVRLMGQDAASSDTSLQSMCNDTVVIYGRNCNFQTDYGPGTCATGAAGSAGTYTNTDLSSAVCPFAYRVQ